MLLNLASKLGIDSSATITKAAEYINKLEIRGSLKSLNISASCLQIICLELAATVDSITIDLRTSVKLSGVSKRNYLSAYKVIENILGLSREYTIRDLSVQFGCTGVQQLSEKLLQRYENAHSQANADMQSTLFCCAAICAACKKSKIKVERSKLFEMAVVPRPVFENLVNEMEKLADVVLKEADERRASDDVPESLVDRIEQESCNRDFTNDTCEVQTTNVDFEEWKRKILAQAL